MDGMCEGLENCSAVTQAKGVVMIKAPGMHVALTCF